MRPPLRDVNQDSFAPNSAMDAAIDAKIKVARLRDYDLARTEPEDPSYSLVMAAVGLTESEIAYLARRYIFEMAQVEIGRRVMMALKKHCNVAREDLIPCVQAYFAAVDAGEAEPV